MEKEEITAVYRNHLGEIISFQTSEGRIISYRKAIAEALEEKITGVNIMESNDENSSLSSFNEVEFENLPSYD